MLGACERICEAISCVDTVRGKLYVAAVSRFLYQIVLPNVHPDTTSVRVCNNAKWCLSALLRSLNMIYNCRSTYHFVLKLKLIKEIRSDTRKSTRAVPKLADRPHKRTRSNEQWDGRNSQHLMPCIVCSRRCLLSQLPMPQWGWVRAKEYVSV